MAELTVGNIDKVLASAEPYYLVQVLQTKGSTPRDAGAVMIVGPGKIYGTIGGGSAEWVAICVARSFIDGAKFVERQTITLGPEIDQCCGGTIEVAYKLLNEQSRQVAIDLIAAKTPANVLIFGAGHTGLALANALAPLTVNIQIIDSRTEYGEKFPNHNIRCLAMPEEAVRGADKGAIYIITTHDHSLDFLITAEVLARGDARYVGMIGSATKRAVLKSWLAESGYDPASIDKLHCPIGGTSVKNKQPEVIAAMTVAEILTAMEVT